MPLHSTMYLFLLMKMNGITQTDFFTFHNVSISTRFVTWKVRFGSSLHSTMYLFLRASNCPFMRSHSSLHSTMYLFLPEHAADFLSLEAPLHSTMYLFLPWGQQLLFTHSISFTFHNVSISTRYLTTCIGRRKSLYIPQCIYFHTRFIVFDALRPILYIPQCIYFYFSP